MRIKRIEIVGFKSFVDKSVLDLEAGITAVVGPNGCGKSNIIDAIRWAMGEQSAKNLRGQGMEDVIFGGCESRKPLGMAEVSLVFANEEGRGPVAFRDYAEIMVTRRLFRSGESDYLINKTPCRLLDISELFMDTGVGARAYSIVEQGKIGMILSAKAEDRRYLIEEAAGVTKFKSRKKTALRKIEATRQNLLRISDIVSEVRRQLGALKRQAQKAERFREYREELKGIELYFARQRYDALRAEEAETSRVAVEQNLVQEGCLAELSASEAQMEEFRLVQVAAEREVAAGQDRLYHLSAEIQKSEDRHALAGREIESQQLQAERLRLESLEVAERFVECDREEVQHQGGSEELSQELLLVQGQLDQGQRDLEMAQSAAQGAATQMETARTRLYALLTELSRFGTEHDNAERRLRAQQERFARNRQEAVTVHETLATAQEQSSSLQANLIALRQQRVTLQGEKDAALEQVRIYKGKIEGNEDALLRSRENFNRVKSRLESLQRLEQDLEGYGSGIKTVLRDQRLAQSFTGMLADLIDVPGEIEVALEAVLGERLQTLLAPDVQTATAALELLRDQGGRSSFLLPTLPTCASSAFPAGQSLSSLVTPQPAVRERIDRLLDGFYLVESLAPYLTTSDLPLGVILVTPRGESLNWRGELNGGANNGLSDGLLHKKREIRELGLALKESEAAVAILAQEREELRTQLQQSEVLVGDLATALHHLELKLVNLEKDLARVQQDVRRCEDRLEVLNLEEDQLHEEQQGLEAQLVAASSGRSTKEAERSEFETLVRTLQAEVDLRRQEVETLREAITKVRVTAASLKEREEGSRRQAERLLRLRQELHNRQTLLIQRSEEARIALEGLQQERQRLQVELELLLRRRSEEQARFDALRATFDARSGEIEAREEILKVLRQRLQSGRELLSRQQLRLREIELEIEHLRESLIDRFRCDLADLPVGSAEVEIDLEKAPQRQAFLRRAIEEIGEVNLMAIDEYRELDERYQFLTRQQEDLKQSLEGLQTAIGKINRTTRKRFRETFDLVNVKFQEIFPRLFRGGKAELRLTDEEDLLETGIDIIVQPPGKKLQNVSLLSGGEKALTAVALIFSIFLVKPSPFCILDEVDAPLDEANIGRFNEMVKEMADISQFVIITHSKRTMEIADILYGVTMEEPGVSKLVSVNLQL
ncbi:MAG: chromosome segregation protein SMC [Desulfuromonadales bacterium]|nr:chromosome segregation protein SMC [Desulfuromonadales bacterium]